MRSHSTAVTVSSATAETAAGVRLGTWLGSVWPTRRTRIACVLLLADVCSRHSTASTVTVPAVPLMSDAFGGHLAFHCRHYSQFRHADSADDQRDARASE